jgi:hypothetical protein
MLTSTLLKEGPTPVAIWALILASCDRYGVSKLTASAAASLLRIKDEDAELAFAVLQGDDSGSRNKDKHGQRIFKNEEGHYVVVSYPKYRRMASKSRAAERQAEYRERCKKAAVEGKPAPDPIEDEDDF